MSNIDKQALTDEAISKAFAGTNFGRDDFKNILAETVIDAAAGWRCGYTATTICTQLGLLTPKGCASALGLRFISEHVQRETKRLKDELEAAEKLAQQQGNIAVELFDEVTKLRRNADDKAPELRSQLEEAEKRIAELEAREVKLPAEKFCPAEYAGSQLWEETEIWNKAVQSCEDAIRTAGIKVAAAGKGGAS